MADVKANIVVSSPRAIFTASRSLKAMANGKIYIGKIDTDPTIPGNQIPVYIENEDGSTVQIGQPLVINAGGKIVYNGSVVKVVTVQGHSMAIYDAYGALDDYIPNVLKYDPDRLRQELSEPGGVELVNGAAKQEDLDKLKDKNSGYVSILDFIPENLHQYLSDYSSSSTSAGDLSAYLNQASDYCESNHKDLVFPFGYYFTSKTFFLPAACTVIGEGFPYILATTSFTSPNIIVSCDKTGQPTYCMDGFNINGNSTSSMIGIRIGGCRNSVFRRITVTNCPSAGIEVYPTDPASGDVENLEINHLWTVLSGGLHIKANASIGRGNITDAEIYNCQLTTGDSKTVGAPALRLTGAAGKEFFGIKFDRIFTQTTDNDHIVITPGGGKVYGNTFSCFSGESWTVATGGIANDFSKNAMYVFDGSFVSNSIRDFYGQGLPGNGIQLGSGSSGNTFDGLRFLDKNIVNFNNKWVYIPVGANSNTFLNTYFDGSFNRADPGYGGVAANFVFRDNDGKITDLSGSTFWNSAEIRSISPVLIKRSNIFAISGNQLANYPVDGCAFAATSNGVSVAVPAGATPYFLTIPFSPTSSFSGKFVGFTVKYVCGAMNGMTLSADICGNGSSMTDLTQNKLNIFSAYGAYNPLNKSVTISFLGSRSAQANMELRDIIITEGACIPYMPNFSKLYLES